MSELRLLTTLLSGVLVVGYLLDKLGWQSTLLVTVTVAIRDVV